MRILHVSDLHAQESSSADQSEIIAAFLADVEAQHLAIPVDVTVFSGDLAHSGTTAEFSLGRQMLVDPLADVLGLGPERFFLVPGNHDVGRSDIDIYVDEGVKSSLRDDESVNKLLDHDVFKARAVERLARWSEFESSFYEGTSRDAAPSLGWVSNIEIGGIMYGFGCMNSAWRARGGDGDYQQLILGDRQLQECLDRIDPTAAVRIAIFHHPLDWLTRWDQDTARRRLEQSGPPTVVLTGHQHKTQPAMEHTTRGGAVYGKCGCLYESPGYENGYQLIDIDLAEQNVQFTMRRWYKPRMVFDAATDIAGEGVRSFPLAQVSPSTAIATRPYSEIINLLTGQVHDQSVIADHLPTPGVATLHDMLVAPRLFPLPYKEAIAAATLREGDNGDRPEPFDPATLLGNSDVTVICGDQQSGVTNGLLWLQALAYESDATHLPVYVAFDPRFKSTRFDAALREKAGAVASLPGASPLPPLLVAVDDIRSFNRGYYDAFAKYILAHPEHRFLLGCHGDDHIALSAALDARGVVHARAFIGPFGSKQVRDLIEKITGQREADLLNKVWKLISLAHLPRTPFIMATLIVVLSRHEQLAALNESGLLDTYVSVLLSAGPSGNIDEQAMDPKRREYFLSWFAGLLTEQRIRRMPRVDAEAAFLQRFQDFGWGAASSPGLVVQSLIDRRVLVQDGDGVGFRLSGLQDFFAAKYMNSNDPFRAAVLADALRNYEIIRHAAGLVRTDRDLLEEVGALAAAHTYSESLDVSTSMFDFVTDRPGWSDEEPGVEQLRRRLDSVETVPVDEEVYDDQVDELYDRLEADSEDTTVEVSLDAFQELMTAVGLASSVLRSSELVDDLELKERLFKEAVHGWGLIAVVWAVQEDQRHSLVDIVKSALPVAADDPDLDARLTRLAELMTIAMLTFIMRADLGTVHMEEVIRRALGDEVFMDDTIHALLATLLYAQLRLPGWVQWLRSLRETHGKHPIVREMVNLTAVMAYRLDTGLPALDRERLESLLADAFTDRLGSPVGPGAVAARGRNRGEVIETLRKSREKQVQRPDEGLPPLDELDDPPAPAIGAAQATGEEIAGHSGNEV